MTKESCLFCCMLNNMLGTTKMPCTTRDVKKHLNFYQHQLGLQSLKKVFPQSFLLVTIRLVDEN